MNGRMAKKIRRETRKAWREYFNWASALPLWNRLFFAWEIVTKRKF